MCRATLTASQTVTVQSGTTAAALAHQQKRLPEPLALQDVAVKRAPVSDCQVPAGAYAVYVSHAQLNCAATATVTVTMEKQPKLAISHIAHMGTYQHRHLLVAFGARLARSLHPGAAAVEMPHTPHAQPHAQAQAHAHMHAHTHTHAHAHAHTSIGYLGSILRRLLRAWRGHQR